MERHAGGIATTHQRRQRWEAVGSPATDKAAKHHTNTQEHDPHQNFLVMVADVFLCCSGVAAVEPVWLCETQVRLSRKTSEPRQSQGRGTGTQIQEQTTSTEIPQEIDVEKFLDGDVDEMILETGVDDDAQQDEAYSDAVTDRHGVPRRRLHRDSGGGTAQDQDIGWIGNSDTEGDWDSLFSVCVKSGAFFLAFFTSAWTCLLARFLLILQKRRSVACIA